ncbi:hypothetical protein, partial [Halolactibacillus sp. JCM 19043]
NMKEIKIGFKTVQIPRIGHEPDLLAYGKAYRTCDINLTDGFIKCMNNVVKIRQDEKGDFIDLSTIRHNPFRGLGKVYI